MSLKRTRRLDERADSWIASVNDHLEQQDGIIYEVESDKYWNGLLKKRRDAYVTVRLYNSSGREVFPKDEWTDRNSNIRYYEDVEDGQYYEIVELDKYW